ncbi:hypothetical protein VTK26DRAFT_8710 [Humicola hyalothermophila]
MAPVSLSFITIQTWPAAHSPHSLGDIAAAELGDVMRELGLNPTPRSCRTLSTRPISTKMASSHSTVQLPFSGIYEAMFPDHRQLAARVPRPHVPDGQGVDTEQELVNACEVFDKDGSGTISSDELSNVFKSLGENLTDPEVDDMLREAADLHLRHGHVEWYTSVSPKTSR